MIYLDARVGAKELLPYFKQYSLQVETTELQFADICWSGSGPDGQCLIGCERKVVSDLVQSMRSNRLSGHQLPGLLESYEWVYLLVEGIWRSGEGGVLESMRGNGWKAVTPGNRPVLYKEVDHYLATLGHVCGLTVVRTSGLAESAAFITSRVQWWEKEWEKHDSYRAVHSNDPVQTQGRRAQFMLPRSTPSQIIAAQLPGLDKRAFEVGKHFRTARKLVNASVKELSEAPGIGKTGAVKIDKWLDSE